MLTWEDCLGVAGVTEELIDAVAEHEHIPETVALELTAYLVHTPGGPPRLKRMILDDIAVARSCGDVARLDCLRHVLAHFVADQRRGQPG